MGCYMYKTFHFTFLLVSFGKPTPLFDIGDVYRATSLNFGHQKLHPIVTPNTDRGVRGKVVKLSERYTTG